jgi:hypothetical protein
MSTAFFASVSDTVADSSENMGKISRGFLETSWEGQRISWNEVGILRIETNGRQEIHGIGPHGVSDKSYHTSRYENFCNMDSSQLSSISVPQTALSVGGYCSVCYVYVFLRIDGYDAVA